MQVAACGNRPREVISPTPRRSPTNAPGGFVCSESAPAPSAPGPLGGSVEGVIRIEVRGFEVARALCEVIQSRAGQAMNVSTIDGDIRRLWALGQVDDVLVTRETVPGGVALTYEVKARRRFQSARIDGARTADIGRDEDYLPDAGPLDPVVIHAARVKLEGALSDRGFRHVAIETGTEPREDENLELVFGVNLGVRSLVKSITFPGATPSRAGEIMRLLVTRVGAPLAADALERDVAVASVYYYDRGMIAVRVHPPVLAESSGGESLDVAIEVEEGPIYKLGTVKLVGDLLDREAEYKKRFWSSAPGATFSRSVIAADIERIREYHRLQGFSAEIEPETDLEPDKKLVNMTIRLTKH